MHRFGRSSVTGPDALCNALKTSHIRCYVAPQDSKIAVDILQSVNNRTQSLREILRMVIIDTVNNTFLGGLTLDPAGMHCPARDDAFVSSYRQDAAKRQTAGIKFTHRTKIRFFAPQGRLVAPIQVTLRRTDGLLGPLGCAKFHLNRPSGVGMRPQKYQKFSLFGTESPRKGDSLDRFPKFLGAFIRLTIVRLAFQISCDSHHRLRSYC